MVLLRILGSEVLEIFFLNARRRSEPNQRAFLVCGDLRCPLTLEGADRIDFGVTLESSMHALRDPALKAAARMPLLNHYHPGMPFEIMESDVVVFSRDAVGIVTGLLLGEEAVASEAA